MSKSNPSSTTQRQRGRNSEKNNDSLSAKVSSLFGGSGSEATSQTHELGNNAGFSSEQVSSNSTKEGSVGYVEALRDGILTVRGLRGVKSGEVVWVKTSSSVLKTQIGVRGGDYLRALVLNLNEESAQAILLGNERLVVQGSVVYRSNKLFSLSCSLALFGKVVDGVGALKGGTGLMTNFIKESSRLVEQKATGIIDRSPVRVPLRTGVKAIDSLVPIGRGQRELIIGDRQTGKTSIGVDVILNHVGLNSQWKVENKPSTLEDLRRIVWFVYNAIGQKQSTVNQLYRTLNKAGAGWFTSIVAATSSESAPLQFLSPYTACTLAEFVRDVVGGHSVVIYDDLSKHAVAYRQMSLLLRRPPGREAFPGDVFYVHSRLLERAGSLTSEADRVRGTLTAFPVIETQAGDVSAYIPTNVISITDGQIFLETEIFYRGIRPAVNVGLSVSRVGSAAQPPIMKRVSGSLKMELAQYREVEGFAKLGASLDEATQRVLHRGESLVEILKQGLHKPLTTLEEVVSLFLGLGYSGSWLSAVNALSLPRNRGSALFSRLRVRSSWFEWFRSLSGEFNLPTVTRFVEELLVWTNRVGLVSLNLSLTAEKSLSDLISNFPLLFFDDLVIAFLKERSLVSFSSFGKFKKDQSVSLYNIVLGGCVSRKKKINQKGSSARAQLKARLRTLSLKLLKRKLALGSRTQKKNQKVVTGFYTNLLRFSRVFAKTCQLTV